jgi:hypothetical protein
VDLRSLSRPVLKRLSRETERPRSSRSSRRAAPRRLPRARRDRAAVAALRAAGRRVPLHAGASQKALLAFLPEDAWSACSPSRWSGSASARSSILRSSARSSRTSVSADGHGRRGDEPRGERIAIPVLSERGGVVCAIGIAGPSARLDDTGSRRSSAGRVGRGGDRERARSPAPRSWRRRRDALREGRDRHRRRQRDRRSRDRASGARRRTRRARRPGSPGAERARSGARREVPGTREPGGCGAT